MHHRKLNDFIKNANAFFHLTAYYAWSHCQLNTEKPGKYNIHFDMADNRTRSTIKITTIAGLKNVIIFLSTLIAWTALLF